MFKSDQVDTTASKVFALMVVTMNPFFQSNRLLSLVSRFNCSCGVIICIHLWKIWVGEQFIIKILFSLILIYTNIYWFIEKSHFLQPKQEFTLVHIFCYENSSFIFYFFSPVLEQFNNYERKYKGRMMELCILSGTAVICRRNIVQRFKLNF